MASEILGFRRSGTKNEHRDNQHIIVCCVFKCKNKEMFWDFIVDYDKNLLFQWCVLYLEVSWDEVLQNWCSSNQPVFTGCWWFSVYFGFKGSMFRALTQNLSRRCLFNTTFDESCLLPKQTSRTSDHFKMCWWSKIRIGERKFEVENEYGRKVKI